MLTATTDLANYLAALGPTETCLYAELYTFTLSGGEVLRYTTADRDVLWNGNLYPSGEVQFQDPNNRALGHWKIGFDVDQWQVLCIPRAEDVLTGDAYPDEIGTQPFLAALFGGALDDAAVEVDYAFFSAPPAVGAVTWTPIGTLVWFCGVVAECDIGESACVLTFNDNREKLGLMMGQKLFQSNCRHVLFGAGCSLTASSYLRSGTAAAGSDETKIVSTIAAPGGTGTYQLGRITMTSGQNSGFTRTVRDWTSGTLHLQNPFYWPVAIGDTFNAWPGCNHTQAACAAFGNSLNYGGEPYIPAPELAA